MGTTQPAALFNQRSFMPSCLCTAQLADPRCVANILVVSAFRASSIVSVQFDWTSLLLANLFAIFPYSNGTGPARLHVSGPGPVWSCGLGQVSVSSVSFLQDWMGISFGTIRYFGSDQLPA